MQQGIAVKILGQARNGHGDAGDVNELIDGKVGDQQQDQEEQQHASQAQGKRALSLLFKEIVAGG